MSRHIPFIPSVLQKAREFVVNTYSELNSDAGCTRCNTSLKRGVSCDNLPKALRFVESTWPAHYIVEYKNTVIADILLTTLPEDTFSGVFPQDVSVEDHVVSFTSKEAGQFYYVQCYMYGADNLTEHLRSMHRKEYAVYDIIQSTVVSSLAREHAEKTDWYFEEEN